MAIRKVLLGFNDKAELVDTFPLPKNRYRLNRYRKQGKKYLRRQGAVSFSVQRAN